MKEIFLDSSKIIEDGAVLFCDNTKVLGIGAHIANMTLCEFRLPSLEQIDSYLAESKKQAQNVIEVSYQIGDNPPQQMTMRELVCRLTIPMEETKNVNS